MAPSLQNGPVVVSTATVTNSQLPPRRRLPIVPAIPRKLEKQFARSSSLAAASHSATNSALDPSNSRIINPGDENPQAEARGRLDFAQDMQATKALHQSEGLALDGHSIGEGEQITETATVEGATEVEPTPPMVKYPSPSILDPESPPFIPEVSKTPTETLEGTASLDEPRDDPKVPYPIQTTATESWNPYQTTSPDQCMQSPMQQPYPTYEPPAPLFYPSAVFQNDKYSNPSTYYNYDPSRSLSFYPQSAHSYVSASPVQSSYEGYAMVNTHALHPRSVSSSNPPGTCTAEKPPGPLMYTPSQLQSQHPQPLPQFGSHFPITPSATPSNSGSQHQGPPPTDDAEQVLPADQRLEEARSHNRTAGQNVSQEYKNWCDKIIETLDEGPGQPAISLTLGNHLIQNFNVPTLADCELYISHVNHRFEPAVLSLHSLLIVQNPKLQTLLQGAEIREDGKRQMLLNVKDQYATPDALKAGIKVCYGGSSSHYTGHPGELASEIEVSTAWMNNALAFAAAGHLLVMTGVAHRGEQIASMVLNWDNLEQALAFAMDTKIQRAWGSSVGLSSFPCNASELLLSCLYFVISNISDNIRLDLTAKSLSSPNLLPTDTLSELPSTKSRLSRIQFGDLPVEAEEPISKQDHLTSAILFSLPFDHLKFILDRVPLNVNTEITRDVVQERERRRLRALDILIITSPADIKLHASLTQEERVHDKE
ncbi:MAG: hypothetical protein Q9223_004448, partial [Gallowayella weberi]